MRRCEIFRLPTAHPADVGALVGGVLAGLTGRTDLFVSGAEHQGPNGGGPTAVIVKRQVGH